MKSKDNDKVENKVEDDAISSQNIQTTSNHNEHDDHQTEQGNHPGSRSTRPGQPGVDTRKKQRPKLGNKDPPTIGVMFVDQMMGCVLVKRLQEVEDRFVGVTGSAWRSRLVHS